jgi:hypothetical protein
MGIVEPLTWMDIDKDVTTEAWDTVLPVVVAAECPFAAVAYNALRDPARSVKPDGTSHNKTVAVNRPTTP